jgi:hypothetical protein
MRFWLGVVALLPSVTLSYAIQQNTAQLGAVVENIRFEQGSRVAFVRVKNTSNKKISAFNLSINLSSKSGHEGHFEQMVDLLPLMLGKQSLAGTTALDDGSLGPNESHEVRIDTNEPVQGLRARVDMVAYLDLSAEVDRNQDALARLKSWRKGRALAAQQTAEVINRAAADSVTPDPRGMAINQLRTLLDEAVAQHAGEREVELRAAISDLQNQRVVHLANQTNADSKADLRNYARRKSNEAEAASLHANIGRTN